MDTLTWVILANALVWIGLGGYLAFLGCTQRRLERDLRHLETLHD